MDRQDIDALLIGALYGELTPADQARLATHLEAHPGDRGALDDLKVARQAVAESRIFAVQLDPPQAVSALLLQEAHRRAPKRVVARDEQEGWFARFARSFMAHPAMAAAAMLVLVMGGAGILWMKNGDGGFAEKQASAPAVTNHREAESAVSMPPAGGAAMEQGSAAIASGSAFGADLYEQDKAKNELALDGKADDSRAAHTGERARAELAKDAEKKVASRGIAVTTDRAPKDLDEGRSRDDVAAADKLMPKKSATVTKGAAPGSVGGGAKAQSADFGYGGESSANAVSGAGAVRGGGDGPGYAQPPPPPPTNGTTAGKVAGPATATTTSPKVVTKTPAPAEKPTAAPAAQAVKADPAPAKEAKPDSSLVAWAKGEHARAVTMAKNADCAGAAKVALNVSNRASSYYAQYMATDRQLKQCAQYVNAERDRDAEKKARASKRVNADESAPTQSK